MLTAKALWTPCPSAFLSVAQEIREIAHDSEGLLEINSVIQNIASQTNLLSMNAAIEAVDYIKKPYDKDDLLNRIGKIVK